METVSEFRRRIREKYPEAFALHSDVAIALEDAFIRERSFKDPIHLALDMFMLQAYKAHLSVGILAEYVHVEDAATITRRLMELGVQAAYIAGNESDSVCDDRARRYLAHMWSTLPGAAKARLPEPVRQQWDSIYASAKHLLPEKRTRWGPSWFEMFDELGRGDTYKQDYSLLSAIAHGTSDDLILTYSSRHVRVRSDLHVPTLLKFAARYYVAVADQWNLRFGLLDAAQVKHLIDCVTASVSTEDSAAAVG